MNHTEFLTDVAADLNRETKACRCGCGHELAVQSAVVVAMVHGTPEVFMSADEGGCGEDAVRAILQAALTLTSETVSV